MGELAKISNNLSKLMGGKQLISLSDEMLTDTIRLILTNGLIKMHEIMHDEDSSKFEIIAAFKNVLATDKQLKTAVMDDYAEEEGAIILDNDELKIGG